MKSNIDQIFLDSSEPELINLKIKENFWEIVKYDSQSLMAITNRLATYCSDRASTALRDRIIIHRPSTIKIDYFLQSFQTRIINLFKFLNLIEYRRFKDFYSVKVKVFG